MSKRIMALDIGKKRIGVALSDPLGISANPLKFIDGTSKKKAFQEIMGIVNEYEVGIIVVGHPLRMDGTEGEQALYSSGFADYLRANSEIEVVLYDERFTSSAADRLLIEAGLSREKRKLVNDKVAASLILQNYLLGKKS